MPPALALLLLLGLGAHGGRGCLQCEVSVVGALSHLRWALIPQRFHQEQLRARAQALLMGMEGPFFRDYSVNGFVGKVGLDHLELVVTFVKNETTTLQNSALRDGPLMEELVASRERVTKKLKTALKLYELKDFLKEEVLDCLHCQKISPRCIRKKYCFVDGQPRMALHYRRESRELQNPAVLGIIAVLCLAALFLGVILVS
ncbi:Izumo sperm-egg fusion protein 2 [Galemys pyrenaicus]|uniref:Izumo sperm-egg fusion protein 2 n=1 Tax=Galemys pyrenaicus TaxID=202257 RepID=A0A8J6AN60_GALPY|nr:Izumo sperm-egg fusion protein 2 [Galemys pyrenaicus]